MSDARHRYRDPDFHETLAARFDADVAEIATLSAELCSVPGVTVPASEVGLAGVIRTAAIVRDWAGRHGLAVVERTPTADAPFPFLIVTFKDHDLDDPDFRQAVALIGHLDVVQARSEGQFEPFVEGDDLHARGATDMKTVVASYLVWMARRQRRPGAKPPILLTLSCTEENGSPEPHHTLSTLEWLRDARGVDVRFAVVGERTGELEWMAPPPVVGPVCAENRSWRWLRGESASGRGMAALRRIADAVELGRTTIATLNAVHTPESKAARQPGVRSGFVNPFCIIQGDEGADAPGAVLVQARRTPGTAIHSAQAAASDLSLLESFLWIAGKAADSFGEDSVRLGGVAIGEDRNFNTYDGSGSMTLAVTGAERDAVAAWAAELDAGGIETAVAPGPAGVNPGPTVVGIDIRELLDHKAAVEELIGSLRDMLSWGILEMVIDLPPWRCPDDHPDLVALRAAWQKTVGHPSPDLVKLHGNDGGHLAALQQARDPEAARRGHVVVFGQVGAGPHGPRESARLTSIRPYLDILDAWADALETVPVSV
jgi:acetylornithine deacetylase/succinyl-diaminopimelate desuccinylase-like protein